MRFSRPPSAFASSQQVLTLFPSLSPDYLNDLQGRDDDDSSPNSNSNSNVSWDFYGSSVCGEQPYSFQLGGEDVQELRELFSLVWMKAWGGCHEQGWLGKDFLFGEQLESCSGLTDPHFSLSFALP